MVAVRGTSSVEDVITDSVAEPERLPPEWLPEGGAEAGAGAMFAHSGIKAAAESILDVRWAMLRSCCFRFPWALGALEVPRNCVSVSSHHCHVSAGRIMHYVIHYSVEACVGGECWGRTWRRAGCCRRCLQATTASASQASCPPRRLRPSAPLLVVIAKLTAVHTVFAGIPVIDASSSGASAQYFPARSSASNRLIVLILYTLCTQKLLST